jgi:hypothetical protein
MLRTLSVLICVGVGEIVIGQTFSSSGELSRVFHMERELVEVLRAQKARLEEGLDHVSTYTQQVEDMYSKNNCANGACGKEFMMENIVGNPIYGYQVLKRMHVYFKNVEATLKDVDVKRKRQKKRKS